MSHNTTEAALSSTGCPVHTVLPSDPVPFFSNGNIHFKAHDVGWLVSGVFTIIAIVASAWLIMKHLSFFYAPHTQRHVVRILFLVPIYAVMSFLSYYFYNQALYFQLLRDCYEAIVIAAFFFLLLAYLSNPPSTDEDPFPAPYATRAERVARLREVCRDVHLKKWMWPFGFVKWRPAGGGRGEGEAFLWYMRIGIGQYVIVRPLSTLIAVISHYLGYYCLASWSPAFTHLWCALAITISVTVAMYCVLQLYMPLKKELQPFSPVLKFLAVKSVVFLTFWQESGLSLLETVGVITDRQYWTAGQIVIGISALLSCFEMMCFAFLHIKAFSYLPYRALAPPVTTTSPSPNNGDGDEELEKLSTDHRHPQRNEDGSPVLRTTKKWQALKKCLVLSDLWRELKEETVFVASRKRREEALMDRAGDLEEAMGRARTKTSKQAAFEEELWGNSIERGIKKAKEKEENVRRGVKIAEDGSIIYPSSKKPNKMFDPGYGRASNEEGRSLLRGGDDTTFSFYQIERPVQQHIPFAEESITDFPTSLSPSRPLIAARRGSGPPRPLELRLPPPLQLPTATQENVTSSSSVPSHSSSPPNPSLARTSTFGAPTRRSHIRRHSAVPLPSPSSTNFTPTRNSFDSISQPYTHNHDQPTSPPPFVLPSPLPSSVQRNVTGLSASASRHVTRHSTHLEQQSVQSLKVFASEQSKRSQGLPRGAAPPVWSSGR